ncbi:hypothetical protein KGF54_001519 [Candida jiufengensis]|uniref:uncharacterized protein n=1 Tax=Candida jiufengensis TaxID=497108 RepID=UPI0022251A3C|nr:uncharacterized protein KGF54_001519 [Candida jiufengensis]KAI5954958.1 hypothetical protein KGF54_001519 [Candida jiufengensis]
MTEVDSSILKSNQQRHLQSPVSNHIQQPPQQQPQTILQSIQPSPVIVKTSKEWVLPPRPKPGRKLKDCKENKQQRKKNCKKQDLQPQQSSTLQQEQTTSKSTTPQSITSPISKCISKELKKDLNSDLSTVSSLLQNLSIIDSENNYLKSNLLCLIHEYKHLKNLVLNPSTSTSNSTNNQTISSSTSTTCQDSTNQLTQLMNATSINNSDLKVHKRCFNEVIEEEAVTLEEEQLIQDQDFATITTTSSPSSYDSSNISTTVSTPSTNILSEFEKFINIEESIEPLKKCKTNDSIKPVITTTTKSLRSKKFAHYKDFHKLDTEEDSDLDINFEDDEEYEEEEEDHDHDQVYSPTSQSSISSNQNDLSTTTTNEELSRTTSPYNSDFETNSLMSSLTRSTTVSSINTVIHEKPPLCNVHSQPFTLKKMGQFFELPKTNPKKEYKFKFDQFVIDEQKRNDDEYNMITDILEEKLMNNEINYYVYGNQQFNGENEMNVDW